MATFIQANHTIQKLTSPKSSEVIGPYHKLVIEQSLESGNFVVTQNKATAFAVNSTSQTITHLHQASGHPSYKYFKQMYPNRQIPHLDCSTYNARKMTKIPFQGTFPTCHQKLEFLHLDLCGPISPASVSGSKYFLRIMDGYSHFVWIFFLQIRISHLTSAPYTPEQNPFAERGNHTTVKKSRCLLKDSGLGLSYWDDAANTAVYLENLTPQKAINFQTPYFKWLEQNPSLKNLHPFGCKDTSLILSPPSKFNQKGELGIFIGYGEGHRTYQILNLETVNVKISHHVKLNNNIFPSFSYLDSNKTDTFTFPDNLYLPFINPNVKISNISHPTKENPTQMSSTLAYEESEIPI
ncbi:hypothetical protein O181_097295 [Austropuccinia psidii MF-1]|uniref:Integrase catalytic domain-containing protein n=1 Tax=Austropuccinia psidii MF-1 TaxID=1389203 RepID=A0A9Q3J791_9BASI|nr:hypothetical protein [Austropuccinia psidii MF-1]